MPGIFKSSGTGGTRQVPVFASLVGGWLGATCCFSALEDREPSRTKLVRARVQLIVESRQIVAKGGREQGRRRLPRGRTSLA
jgi:hypothetical protein